MYTILLLLAINPPSQPTFDRVDRVELSHVYNDSGALVLDQVIWHSWSVNDCRYQVVDWRLLQGCRRHDQATADQWCRDNPEGPPYVAEWLGGHATPHREGSYWVSDWFDEKTRTWRRVLADQMLETWTLGDPELAEREVLPEARRRKLR